jgi:hypothetical protein
MTATLRRLARMRPAEVRWRSVELARTGAEAAVYTFGGARWRREALLGRLNPLPELSKARAALSRHDWATADRELRTHFRSRPCRFQIDPARREHIASEIRGEFPESRDAAVTRASRLADGRFDLLGYEGLAFGQQGEIDWHLDPAHQRRARSGFWRRVRYLDPAGGDHKIIWELNRHQHWLALGRAAWLTGDARYTDACVRQLGSWMSANPPLTGMNWSSMLELGFRTISWLWTLHFVLGMDGEDSDQQWLVDLLLGLDRQLEHVAAHLSTYFSPNTHLLGEGLALYVAGQVLPELHAAARWSDIGRGVLLEQASAQVHADGGHAELSAHYHRYALDFYLLALAVARRSGDPAAQPFAEVVARTATFARMLADNRGRLPLIGDDDGGMLFPIGGREPADIRDSLSLAAALIQRPDLAASGPTEEALWMLGGDRSALVRPATIECPPSKAFPDTGYIVLRSSREHLIFDAGPHGFANGGHAHADALSLVLSTEDEPFLIDPGTATYTMDAAVRDRFRSTAMHNTLVLDGRMQSEPAGPFHWRSQARARTDVWRPGSAFDYVEGSHHGYEPVVHRRAILTTRAGLWVVVDHILPPKAEDHTVEMYWHLDPSWKPHWSDRSSASFVHTSGRWAAIASTTPLREQFRGDEQGLGWCAPAYGHIVPAVTLRDSAACSGPASWLTVIGTAPAPQALAVERIPVTADTPEDGWHRMAASITFGSSRFVALFSTPEGPDAAARPSPHRVTVEGATLATDARAALLHLSEAGLPLALSLVDGRAATWSGKPPVTLALPAPAADLHLDIAAQRRLSRAGGTQRFG